jgi:hypothetical protein
MTESFKKCSMCGKEWETLKGFICDKQIKILGVQEGEGCRLVLFYHKFCGTTLAVPFKLIEIFRKREKQKYLEKQQL